MKILFIPITLSIPHRSTYRRPLGIHMMNLELAILRNHDENKL